MTSFITIPPIFLTLRARITAWYVLLVALTLVCLSVYLYFSLESSLISQVDAALLATTSQAAGNLEHENNRLTFDAWDTDFVGDIESLSASSFSLREGPTFQLNDAIQTGQGQEFNGLAGLQIGDRVKVEAELFGNALVAIKIETEDDGEAPTNLDPFIPESFAVGGFVYRVGSDDGAVWDVLGDWTVTSLEPPMEDGFTTGMDLDNRAWRIYSKELFSGNGDPIGWIQTARSLESVQVTLSNLRTQLYWGLFVAVLVAAFGGLFLAHQGLRPIGQITRTAQEISGSVLNRRIDHQGPDDEVGRLARTVDAMLDRLEGAFQRERRFTSDASHELRTPLTALKGRIDVILSSPRSQSEYEGTLQSLEEEVDRLIRLSNELLFLARLDQGKLPWQPEEVDLGRLLGAVVDQVRPAAEAKELSIDEELPENLVIQSDPDQLIRLFLNLLDNACQYTPAGGLIRLGISRTDDTVRVFISDTGPGISEEHLPHLFDRFYRVDPSRSRESGGTGLGLSIAHEISQISHGKIEVSSKLGVGSTFTVVLPYPGE